MTPSSFRDHPAQPAQWLPAPLLRSTLFSPVEWHRLYKLRLRFRREPDLFSDRELEQLRFLRWLHNKGCLQS
jgi:hypothetical protein